MFAFYYIRRFLQGLIFTIVAVLFLCILSHSAFGQGCTPSTTAIGDSCKNQYNKGYSSTEIALRLPVGKKPGKKFDSLSRVCYEISDSAVWYHTGRAWVRLLSLRDTDFIKSLIPTSGSTVHGRPYRVSYFNHDSVLKAADSLYYDSVQFRIGVNTSIGELGNEGLGIYVNGILYEAELKISDEDNMQPAQLLIHRHSTAYPAAIAMSRSNSDDSSHVPVSNGMVLGTMLGIGYAEPDYKFFSVIELSVADSGGVNDTSSPGKISFKTTPIGSTDYEAGLTMEIINKKVTVNGNIHGDTVFAKVPLPDIYPPPGTGSVTSITAAAPLTGGAITTSGTIGLGTAGTSGTYSYPSSVVTDVYGRVTSITGGSAPPSGTVTSVGMAVPAIFSVTPTAITTSGTFSVTTVPETANYVWAGPTTGAASQPSFRALVGADIPTTAVTPGSYGDATHIPALTIDNTGRITAATTYTVSAGGSSTTLTAGPGIALTTGVNTYTVSVAANTMYDNGNSSTAKTWDGVNGTIQKMAMTGNCVITLQNLLVGVPYYFYVTQSAGTLYSLSSSGSSAIDVPFNGAGVWPLTQVASAVDKYTVMNRGTIASPIYDIEYSPYKTH